MMTCGCCGLWTFHVELYALYVPCGEQYGIPYILCGPCGKKRLRSEADKHEVMNLVELRIGPMRGAA
jgi:hypothetical protein